MKTPAFKNQPLQHKSAEPTVQQKGKGRTMAPPDFSLAGGKDGKQPTMQAKFPGQELTNILMAGMLQEALEGPTKWADFATGFNTHFGSVLHMFGADGPQVEGKDGEFAKKGDASGQGVTAEQLQALFTEKQRDQLLSFFATNIIPERLFNGDEQGSLTAQQRIMLSAVILSKGEYSPGAFDQKVHAKNCGHWVQTTQNYAGVTSHHGPNANSINGNFDLHGNVLIGAETGESVYKGERVKMKDLPKTESKEIGPIYSTTGHGKEAAKRGAAAGEKSFRNKHLPMERFGEIKAGDWLYIYNANGSGDHSVIFSRWASDVLEADGIPYRQAITFDQGQPDQGGKEHMVELGQQFHSTDKISISPITLVSRVDVDARPATTVEELLPSRGEKEEGKLKDRNLKFIAQAEKGTKKKMDMAVLQQHFIDENRDTIEYLDDRLTEDQKTMLNQANVQGNLESLIRLTQRLRQLKTNAKILATNTENLYEGKLNDKHEALEAEYNAKKEGFDLQLSTLDTERGELQSQSDLLTSKKNELDTGPEVSEARKGVRDLDKEIKQLGKGHPDLAQKKADRAALIASILSLKKTGKDNKKAIADLKTQLTAVKKKLTSNGYKRGKVEKQLAEAQKSMPWGMVAEGSGKGMNSMDLGSSKDNIGRLDWVITLQDLKALMK